MAANFHVEALNLRHLRAWTTVVEEGSITAGAKRLGVSQPALSQQLRALEVFFGSKLLERLPRGIKPTPLGRALLAEARATLSTSERLIRNAMNAADLEGGILEIAILPTLVEAIMIEPVSQWQAKHPRVSIRIKEFALQTEMVEEVAMGFGDLAIGVNPPNWTGDSIPLGWDQFVVVFPPNDPLNRDKSAVDLNDLRDRNWVLFSNSNGLSDYVSAACATAGFRPREAVRTSQVMVAMQLAMAGLGVALVPLTNVPEERMDNVRFLTRPIAWEIAAFSRGEFSAPAQAFGAILSQRKWRKRPANAMILPGD